MIKVVDIGCTVRVIPSPAEGTPRPSAVVSARGESGAIGLGEATPLPGRSPDTVDDCARAVAALRAVLPLTLSPASAVAFAAELASAVAGGAPAARFAIESALCDLVARTAGWPLARLLTAAPAPIVPINALCASADEARAAVARGVACVKLKLRGRLGEDPALARAVGDAIGASVALRVDANLAWPPAEIDLRLAALAAIGVEYVEEPAPGFARAVRAPLAAPLALDESLADADPGRDAWLDDALASGAIAAVVLKPSMIGGLAASLALAERARAHGVDAVVTHAVDGPLAVAGAWELAGAFRRARADGLDRHAGLAPGAVPQLAAAAVRDSGRPGIGVAPPAAVVGVAELAAAEVRS